MGGGGYKFSGKFIALKKALKKKMHYLVGEQNGQAVRRGPIRPMQLQGKRKQKYRGIENSLFPHGGGRVFKCVWEEYEV